MLTHILTFTLTLTRTLTLSFTPTLTLTRMVTRTLSRTSTMGIAKRTIDIVGCEGGDSALGGAGAAVVICLGVGRHMLWRGAQLWLQHIMFLTGSWASNSSVATRFPPPPRVDPPPMLV